MNIKYILTKHRIDPVKFRRDAKDFADEIKTRFPKECYYMVNGMMQSAKNNLNRQWRMKNYLQQHAERFNITVQSYDNDSFSRQVRLKFNKLEREKIALELHWLKDVIGYLNGKKSYQEESNFDEQASEKLNQAMFIASNQEETKKGPNVMAFVSTALLLALAIAFGIAVI